MMTNLIRENQFAVIFLNFFLVKGDDKLEGRLYEI